MQPLSDDDTEEAATCVKALPKQDVRKVDDATTNMAPQGMFCDADAMKRKVRDAMLRPTYDVCNFYKEQGMCQLVARSRVFEYMTLSVIALNAVWIAIDTDLNTATTLLSAHPLFQVAEHFFCVYFSFEWVVRFGAFQRKLSGFKDYWFLFDSFMVFMMVGETWVMSIALLATGSGGGGGGMGDASILRLLRLLRLSRMARMAKLLRSMPELLFLIKGMVSAMKSLVYTLSLLCVLVYVFAIAFRQLTDESDVGKLYFSSMLVSMHTLWLDGTLLDGVGNVVRALEKESVAYVFIWYLFILLAAVTIMNMLIGILCEVVTAVAATEREQITFGLVNDGFQRIINQGGVDTNGDNQISKDEFEGIVNNPDATRLPERVEADVCALVDLADLFFDKDGAGEDVEDGEKNLSFSEFMDIVLSMRGQNQAMVKDMVDLRKYIKGSLKDLEEKLKDHGLARLSRASYKAGVPMLQKQNTCSVYLSDQEAAEPMPRPTLLSQMRDDPAPLYYSRKGSELSFASQSREDPAPPHDSRQECQCGVVSQLRDDPAPLYYSRKGSELSAASRSREDPGPPHDARQGTKSSADSESRQDPASPLHARPEGQSRHPHEARPAQGERLAEVAPAPGVLWKRMVRLQGVLSAACREVHGLLESLPPAPTGISGGPQRGASGDCSASPGSGSPASPHLVHPTPGLHCPGGTGKVVSPQPSTPSPRTPPRESRGSWQQEAVQEQLRDLPELRARLTGLGQALAAGVSGKWTCALASGACF